jgi:microcystin-dependent protein
MCSIGVIGCQPQTDRDFTVSSQQGPATTRIGLSQRPRHRHGITSNAGSAQAAPCESTSADQVVKMSSGRNADTRKLGTSTSWLTLRSTATLQMAYAC